MFHARSCIRSAAFLRRSNQSIKRTVQTKTAKSTQSSSMGKLAFGIGATATMLTLSPSQTLTEENIHAMHLPWTFNGMFSSYDMAAVRRGHEVYQNICATCHSLKGISFRNLVGTLYDEAEAKMIAAEIEVVDGPDEEGNMFERPGALSDYFPKPYKNDEEAKFINNGALPPDLTLITKARHGGPDYIYSLLMGYKEPPAGVTVRQGLHYNPYFPGGNHNITPH